MIFPDDYPNKPPKCFSPDTRVLMYDNTVRCISDINAGDRVWGDDNTARTVTGVIPIQPGHMNTIQQSNGIDYDVNDEHMLVLIASGVTPTLNCHAYPNYPDKHYWYLSTYVRCERVSGYHVGDCKNPVNGTPCKGTYISTITNFCYLLTYVISSE